ncbi:MAG: SH3 domain-containing protein [Cyanobacteria bacterium J06626_14]
MFTLRWPRLLPLLALVGTLWTQPAHATPAVLNARDADGRINVRSEPSINASARHYGFPGDRLEVMDHAYRNDEYFWFYVRFLQSNAEGWVRGDLVRFIASDNLNQTYTNPDLGFRLNYPDSYVLTLSEENYRSSQSSIKFFTNLVHQSIVDQTYVEGDSWIEILVYDNPRSLSPLAWAQENQSVSALNNDSYQWTNLDGHRGVTYTWCGLLCNDTIVLTNDDRNLIYLMSVGYADLNDPLRQDFLLMLSTFRTL